MGNLVRYLDYDTLMKPFSERLIALFIKIGKENHNVVREFFAHYSYIISKRMGME